MKRGVFDTLRRGLDNLVANWQLVAIRVAEGLFFALLAVLTAFAILVPILVSVGIELAEIHTPDDLRGAAFSLLEKWPLLAWAFVAVLLLVLVFVAVHSAVEAGSARVYVDGDRAGGPEMEGARTRFHAFSMERWWAGARQGWWTIFWIYNLAWGVGGLFLLIPLLPTLGMTLIFQDVPAVSITSGCVGLVLTALLAILVTVVTSIWTNRAIADWATLGTGASKSLSHAWAAMKADLGRHVLLALGLLIVAMAGSSVFASFSAIGALGQVMHERALFGLASLPLRFAGTFLNMIFSSFVSAWALASFAALSVESSSRRVAESSSGGVPVSGTI
ncbi:MAG: hypothetical protein ABI779_00390 [Acidobacteriota bacterium]